MCSQLFTTMNKSIIKQILFEQNEEIEKIFQERLVSREIIAKSRALFKTGLIKVIIGVRRCGKSVLAHFILKDKKYGYINFDDERLIGIKIGDLNYFLEVLQEIIPDCAFLLLDEIQNINGWELFVNRLKRNGYNITITGSNSKLLSKELADHLTGRHFSIELYPFSFKEFLMLKDFAVREKDLFISQKKAKIKMYLEEYIQYGGLPEVIKIEPKMQYLRELYGKIITRDIISRYKVKFINDLKEVAVYAISNFASKMSYHKIRNIFEMKSVHTVKNYVNYLEDAYLLFQVNAFSFKLKQQFKLPKKLYCIDTGIINAIVPKNTVDKGRIMENVVYIELKRRGKEVYFYSQAGYEVDFLIREERVVKQLMQVCYSLEDEDTKKRELKALLKASEELNCGDLTIISHDTETEIRMNKKKIKIISLWRWLLQ